MSIPRKINVDIKTGVSVMERIEGKVGSVTTDLTQASLTSITTETFYKEDGLAVAAGTLTLDKTVVIFDILKTIDWTVDAIGYNFRWDIPATVVTQPGLYFVTVIFTPVVGTPFKVKYQLQGIGDTN